MQPVQEQIKMTERKLGLATRDAYGEVLVELGKTNPNVVVLDADLSKSTKTNQFGKVFPDRFFNIGIQEANMVSIAGGLASCGKIPFLSSFACFVVGKAYDQLRMSIAYPGLSVNVVASHGGITVGEDGVSQQSIEDIALMTSLPNFIVAIPSDEHCARALVRQCVEVKQPVYIRTCRPKAPLIHSSSDSFQFGKGIRLKDGKDITLVANGLLVAAALDASETLSQQGISASVVEIHTIKPLDKELLVEEARKTGAVVTAEEHQIWGGLGAHVAQLLSQQSPVPMEYVAIQDTYAESGKPAELLKKYNLDSDSIVKAALRVIKRKS